MQKAEELVSILIKILNQNSKETILGYIYWYPCMDPAEFNDVYLHDVLEKLKWKQDCGTNDGQIF